MHRINLLIIVAVAIVTVAIFALFNQPSSEPAWPEKIQGFAFSPFQRGESPLTKTFPGAEEITSDLQRLQGKTNAIRTYSTEAILADIPRLAEPYGINVTVGAWVDANLENNALEIERLLDIAARQRNVVRIIVGNEVVLRGDLPTEQLAGYLDQVRKALDLPVSTAEPWHVWLKNPELANHVDYLAVHMLPYWEGEDVETSVDYVTKHYNELRAAFPNKPIVIAEVGWPSEGRTRNAAVASPSNEAIFLRRFLERAKQEHYIYYIMEAFDQPWKQVSEGAVGAYWGVYDVDRQPKFAFVKPIVRVPAWPLLALSSIIIGSVLVILFLTHSATLRNRGRGFLAIVAFMASMLAVWVVYDYTQRYMTFTSITIGLLLLAGMVGVIAVLLTEAHEWAESHWVKEHKRTLVPASLPDAELPEVSIHIPTYNEPPAMVIATLDAVAKLDYPRFEVIVIDNNTKDPAVWQPVREHCIKLGSRFRFIHVDPLPGFKAGALNYALTHTKPDAEVIAVIDSDYTVTSNWLRDLVPQFADPRIAIVQAPQDYRDNHESLFKAMCHAEYAGFFQIGMVTRNERNAIIQHGTMTMVRRTALAESGGWSEWCITEDAELGLRIFENGHLAAYVSDSYGKGLMPDNFSDFKKQRFRWAYGSIQILRRHSRTLLGMRKSQLTLGQRYHFVAGWLPWLADGMNLLFTAAAIFWSLGMILAPTSFDPPLLELSLLPLALFTFKIAKMGYLYSSRLNASVTQTLGAAIAGLALSHTISLAVATGFRTMDRPFFRTPKFARTQAWVVALLDSRQEVTLLLALWLVAVGVILQKTVDSPDLLVWILVLLVQSLPYVATVSLALISASPRLPAAWIDLSK